MKAGEKMNTYSLDEITEQYTGKPGTRKREHFEQALRLDVLAGAISEAGQNRNLTPERRSKTGSML